MPSVLVFLMTAMLISSCATVEQKLVVAATVKGTADAGANLPDQPADCRKQEAHAEVTAGAEARSVLVRERAALDRQNARTGRCVAFYDDLKTKLGAKS